MKAAIIVTALLTAFGVSSTAGETAIDREPFVTEGIRAAKAKEYIVEEFPDVPQEDLAQLWPISDPNVHSICPMIFRHMSTAKHRRHQWALAGRLNYLTLRGDLRNLSTLIHSPRTALVAEGLVKGGA